MVSTLVIIGVVALLLLGFFILKKLFKLAAIVGAVALGVILGLRLLEMAG